FGPAFNTKGGGWFFYHYARVSIYITDANRYAMERSQTNFKVWFWSRDGCDVQSHHFGAQNIIINLTLAGSTYSQGTGYPSTCTTSIIGNASAFTYVYFDFASIR
ncbi:glycoside hydrolase family 16 protein, partial [Laccaria amethystina LaAM-08-1]